MLNNLSPWTLALDGVAVLMYLVALSRKTQERWVHALFVLAWYAHGLGVLLDMSGWGLKVDEGIRFGFATALSLMVWLVLAVYLVERRFLPLPTGRRVMSGLGTASVLLALLFPGDIYPQITSALMPVHWALGMASYGLFGAALLHAFWWSAAEKRLKNRTKKIDLNGEQGLSLMRLEKMTFQFVLAGFCILSAALVLGWYVTTQWHWEHKIVFSIMAWVVFAALLAGRHFLGWRGRMALRWLYSGCALLLLSYVGSRFVLEVILHRMPV